MRITVNEFINRIKELGDEKWMDTATVRGVAEDGTDLGNIELFNLKFNASSLDIVIDLPVDDSMYDCSDENDYDEYYEEDD